MKITDPMQKHIDAVCKKIRDPEIEKIYRSCYVNTWETTTFFQEDGTTFVITGDIEAMWLRDSTMQVIPYIRLANEDPQVHRMLRGLIERQALNILADPYANAFNAGPNGRCYNPEDRTEHRPEVWERKYEVDSLAFPLYLLCRYYAQTKECDIFSVNVLNAIRRILSIWKTEQRHEEQSSYRFERDSTLVTETLQRNGLGSKTGYTGMTWSGFRPSDDACTYHYLVPSNMLACSVLSKLADIIPEENLKTEMRSLSDEIREGILSFAVAEKADFGRVFAYETDGLGNRLFMDDANLPSLMSAPYFGFCEKDDACYLNTRKLILSKTNPYYYEGSAADGIGSPHTPKNYIWPIALAMQGLSSSDIAEKRRIIKLLKENDAGTGLMHESFDKDNPEKYTRPWFAWACSMFCLLVEDYLDNL